MGTAENNHIVLKLPLLDKPKTQKNYAQPEVLNHTFETLSNLHKLLPNRMMETLYSYKREADKQNCMWAKGEHEPVLVSIHVFLVQTACAFIYLLNIFICFKRE